jgi:hypothetical protein
VSVTICKGPISDHGSEINDAPAARASDNSSHAASSRPSYDFSADSTVHVDPRSPQKKKSKKLETSPCPQDVPRQNSNSAIPTHLIQNFGAQRARLDDIEVICFNFECFCNFFFLNRMFACDQYLFDGLVASQPIGVKVNSGTELAELCKDPEIRKALRAHSLVEKVRCMNNLCDIISLFCKLF